MPAGFKYNLTPEVEMEERYDVQTGIRRRGPFVLDTTNIPAGAKLPSFAPMVADLKYHKVKLVRNFKVVEALAAAGTSLKVAKGCFPYAGMTIGNGSFVSAVSAIDQSNAGYDVLTIAAPGVAIAKGETLFEAVAHIAEMTVKENAANNATSIKVNSGSGAYPGMKISDGSHTAVVTAVTTGESYDTLTLAATLGAALTADTSKLNDVTVTGAKNVANSALYENYTVTDPTGINNVALLRTAAEIETEKLVIPFSAADRENLKGWFQFNDNE